MSLKGKGTRERYTIQFILYNNYTRFPCATLFLTVHLSYNKHVLWGPSVPLHELCNQLRPCFPAPSNQIVRFRYVCNRHVLHVDGMFETPRTCVMKSHIISWSNMDSELNLWRRKCYSNSVGMLTNQHQADTYPDKSSCYCHVTAGSDETLKVRRFCYTQVLISQKVIFRSSLNAILTMFYFLIWVG